MKGVSVISLSNVQTALQKISKTSIPLVLLFLIFAVGLPSLSLSTNAAQTASGNTPDAGTISNTYVLNGIVVSGTEAPFGGSVIYSVLPNTEYYIRVYIPPRLSNSLKNVRFFSSYPSLGAKAVNYYPDNDISRHGDYVVFHFTTPSNVSFAVLTFRFDSSYTDYESVNAFIQSASIGDTLGLYTPLSNQSKIELNTSFDISFLVTCSASGGVGNYGFNIDVIDNSNNVTRLYTNVSSGEYSISILSVDDNSVIRVTVSDSLGNSSVENFNIDSLPEFVKQLSPPDVDLGLFPEPSLSVDTGTTDIIANAFNVLPSQITVLLVPVVLFCLVGWWLHK